MGPVEFNIMLKTANAKLRTYTELLELAISEHISKNEASLTDFIEETDNAKTVLVDLWDELNDHLVMMTKKK